MATRKRPGKPIHTINTREGDVLGIDCEGNWFLITEKITPAVPEKREEILKPIGKNKPLKKSS
jgi:hypothetical protein